MPGTEPAPAIGNLPHAEFMRAYPRMVDRIMQPYRDEAEGRLAAFYSAGDWDLGRLQAAWPKLHITLERGTYRATAGIGEVVAESQYPEVLQSRLEDRTASEVMGQVRAKLS